MKYQKPYEGPGAMGHQLPDGTWSPTMPNLPKPGYYLMLTGAEINRLLDHLEYYDEDEDIKLAQKIKGQCDIRDD